jgi:hypothetical protein
VYNIEVLSDFTAVITRVVDEQPLHVITTNCSIRGKRFESEIETRAWAEDYINSLM